MLAAPTIYHMKNSTLRCKKLERSLFRAGDFGQKQNANEKRWCSAIAHRLKARATVLPREVLMRWGSCLGAQSAGVLRSSPTCCLDGLFILEYLSVTC